MTTISEQVAQWVEGINYEDIPQEAVKASKGCITDGIGVALAGSTQPVGKIVKEYLNQVGGAKESTAIGLGIKTSSVEAAFANGVLTHVLDYDDLLRPVASAGAPHVTSVILSAALAATERAGKTGKDLIMAHTLGCEITYRMGLAMEPVHYNSGWHNTATEGIFGAVIAASKPLDLNSEQIAYALGIAGSEASGVHENFGTMTKPLHAGQAASKGVKAVLLAKLGFTSSKKIFEGKSGFCNVFCKEPKIEEITKNIGQPFAIPQVCLKFYPCCYGSHSGIWAAVELAKEYDIDPQDIERVEVKCDPQARTVVTFDNPQNSLEGKFSFQFPIALALTEREVTLPEFTDERVKDPDIVSLMQKITVTPSEELRQINVAGRSQVVKVQLKDGRQLEKRCDFAPGSPPNPVSDEELFGKYRDCASTVLSEEDVEKSLSILTNLQEVENIKELMEIMVRKN